MIVILVIANVLGYQHHKFFDLTTEKLYTLSDQTKKIVGGLKNDITVMRFAKTPDQHFDELMAEYHNLESRTCALRTSTRRKSRKWPRNTARSTSAT